MTHIWKYIVKVLLGRLPVCVILIQVRNLYSCQRMSVITRTLGDPYMEVYCKGAPGKIASLCNPDTGNKFIQLSENERYYAHPW